MGKQKRVLSARFVMMLFVLCIGGMQLLFCRVADPELFAQIASPVVSYSQKAWGHASGLLSTGTAKLKTLAAGMTAAPAARAGMPEDMPAEETAAEETSGFAMQEDKAILTGGNVDMVFYAQSGENWRDQPYGTDDIGKYGCGPTAMSMIVSSMTVYDVDPAQMAAWAVENGYWAPKNGSYHAIIPGTAESYGLRCDPLRLQGAALLREELSSGSIVVALMGPGHFTDGGHFIILRGMTPDGDILVADPNSRENSLRAWDAQLIWDELAQGRANNLWRITA